jgi:uncharacterized membrane protein
METHKRAIAKAVSYRLLGSFVTFVIALVVAREIRVAIGIGAADTLLKIFAFYFHERIWNNISFGRGEGEYSKI